MAANAQINSLQVIVEPDGQDAQLKISITLDAKLDGLKLKEWLVLGGSQGPGPSDHEPSYAPTADGRQEVSFDPITLRRGAALGRLWLTVTKEVDKNVEEVIWNGLFQRFLVAKGMATTLHFVDQQLELDVPAMHQDTYVYVLMVNASTQSDPSYPTYQILVSGSILAGKSMQLHLRSKDDDDLGGLSIYQLSLKGTPTCLPSTLSQDRRFLDVKIAKQGVFQLGPTCP